MSEMLEIAKKAARQAGDIQISHFGKRHSFKSKTVPDDIVTEVDVASEISILKMLGTHFKDHGFLAEESGKKDINKEYVWVIDPLDGTSAYSVGFPTFGVSVGLLKNGEPLLGVLNLPKLGMLVWGEKGKGSFLNGIKIQVNNIDKLEKAFVGIEVSRISRRKEIFNEVQLPIIFNSYYTPILGSVVSGMAYVASGVYAAFVQRAYPWDFVAGSIIVTEAGGKVTDFWGKKVNWLSDRTYVIASNGLVHNEILSLIKL